MLAKVKSAASLITIYFELLTCSRRSFNSCSTGVIASCFSAQLFRIMAPYADGFKCDFFARFSIS